MARPVNKSPGGFLEKLEGALCTLGWEPTRTIVAVSGGADSIALLLGVWEVVQKRGGEIIVGHFNHRLRGSESDQDEEFVRELCQRLAVPVVVGYPPAAIRPAQGRGSLEQAARVARYRFLIGLAQEEGAGFILTAHTADDQAETILHRIIRGTGLRGLGGIPEKRQLGRHLVLLRPLLEIRREEILRFLSERQQPFREDTTNKDLHFLRNRIRLQLLPVLEREYHPGVRGALVRLGRLSRELWAFLVTLVERLVEVAVVSGPLDRVMVRANLLVGLPDVVLAEVLRSLWQKMGWPLGNMDSEHWRLLCRMVRKAGRMAEHSDSGASCQSLAEGSGDTTRVLKADQVSGVGNTALERVWAELLLHCPAGETELSAVPGQQMFPGRITATVKPGILELVSE
jgi:tRNA(Ile)-lysidine synthase